MSTFDTYTYYLCRRNLKKDFDYDCISRYPEQGLIKYKNIINRGEQNYA